MPVGGRSLISRAAKAVCDAGAGRILVAVDASIADVVAPAIGELRGAEVEHAIQPDGDEEATMRALDKVLGTDGPLLVTTGDALVTEIELPEAADGGVIELKAAWHYDGTVDSLLEANTLALDGLKRGRVGVDLSNANVQGRVHIDPGAELIGAKLRGPVYIGPGARSARARRTRVRDPAQLSPAVHRDRCSARRAGLV